MRINAHLAQKLRFSTAVLVFFVLLGSTAAYLRMREASLLSEDVVARQMPAMLALRDLRQHAVESSTALKSYLLFGIDPAMARRYQDQFESSLAEGDRTVSQLNQLRSARKTLMDAQRLDAVLAEYKTFVAGERSVEQMAVGQGSEATGKAFDLLQGEVAQHYDSLYSMCTALLEGLSQTTESNFQQIARLNRVEAIYMWTFTLVGGLLGLLLSELAVRRVVRSVLMVAGRAQAISEGDLTGESLAMEANDEITGLARSINRMQENLREMIGTMIETSATVNKDAAELTRSAADSSRRTQEQSQQTGLVANSMQEMSASIAEVSRHAQNAAESARNAAQIAREGGSIVDEVLAGMQGIADSVQGTAETVRRLGKESEQIIRIVNVIEEIAQKTNLLALNAAIEAARAGEQGRGFAVVAGEVRRLAESTRDATSEIAQTIQQIQAKTRGAVEAMDTGTETVSRGVDTTRRAGESLARIIEAADQVDGMIAQIAEASTKQAGAARQSSQNVESINRLGEEAAAAIPATNLIVQSVESGAKRLQEHIGHFRLGDEQKVIKAGRRPKAGAGMALAASR